MNIDTFNKASELKRLIQNCDDIIKKADKSHWAYVKSPNYDVPLPFTHCEFLKLVEEQKTKLEKEFSEL